MSALAEAMARRHQVVPGSGLVVTREVRERAAEALSVMACDRASPGTAPTLFLHPLPDYGPDRLLATMAFEAVPSSTSWPEVYAEAEAWVRCGWMPGDDPRHPSGTAL